MKCTLGLILASFTYATASDINYTIEADWSSKYIEQGHETVGDDIFSAIVGAQWDSFSAFALYRYAPDQDFQEWNFGLHYT